MPYDVDANLAVQDCYHQGVDVGGGRGRGERRKHDYSGVSIGC